MPIPNQDRTNRPSSMRRFPISRARLEGIAKPMPTPTPIEVRIMEFTPMTSLLMLTNGPPELPTLILASVWMKSWSDKVRMSSTCRPLALTWPKVTLYSRSKGAPMAMANSPTFTESESANFTGIRPGTFSVTWMTARSDSGSRPRTSAFTSRPSLKTTKMASASSTTWLLVRIYPSSRITIPDPRPL